VSYSVYGLATARCVHYEMVSIFNFVIKTPKTKVKSISIDQSIRQVA